MLNPFPELLAWSFLAPTLLRLIIGIIFISMAASMVGPKRSESVADYEAAGFRPGKLFAAVFGWVALVGGVLVLIGLWTQVAALVLALVTIGVIVMKKRGAPNIKGLTLHYFLILLVLVSLLISGAGALAIDLPL